MLDSHVLNCRVPVRPQPVSRRDNARFVSMLPSIRKQVRFAFRSMPAAMRAEHVDEALSQAFVLFAHLARRGRVRLAYPTALARYAVRRVRSGRRIGSPQNHRDILSRTARRRWRFQLHSIDASRTPRRGIVTDLLLGTRSITPADLAALRIDFDAWLGGLSQRRRNMALCLAIGESTSVVAGRFGVSFARISQIRSELAAEWHRFQGEADQAPPPNGHKPLPGSSRLQKAVPAI